MAFAPPRRFGAVNLALLCAIAICLVANKGRAARIEDGKLFVRGRHVFLKTAVPLANYATMDMRATVDSLLGKGYNTFKINLYWHHFDNDGDGALDVPLKRLDQLISHIEAKQAFWVLAFETYNVGGGGVPEAFFAAYPSAQARDSKLRRAVDSEYGTLKRIPSIFHPAYLQNSRAFIRNLLRGLAHRSALYFETTVEPQFIGNQALDYSDSARQSYRAYCAQNNLAYSWPPAEGDPQWNRFRAYSLASWVNGDARAIRSIVGDNALIAVDYLETGGTEMYRRNGDSMTFLRGLDRVDILQCNWHWQNATHRPFDLAYDNARSLITAKGWAIAEHMTLNGRFPAADTERVLQHTLAAGNRLGWEVVNARPSSGDRFATYNTDWSPKPMVAPLDQNHALWMSRAYGGAGARYASQVVASGLPKAMVSGQTHPVWVDLQNIGTETWNTNTRLATSDARDRRSPFFDDQSWLSANRLAASTKTATGGVARFSFTLKAPEVSETVRYVERYALVQEGVQWFSGDSAEQDLVFEITVVPEAAVDGGPSVDAGSTFDSRSGDGSESLRDKGGDSAPARRDLPTRPVDAGMVATPDHTLWHRRDLTMDTTSHAEIGEAPGAERSRGCQAAPHTPPPLLCFGVLVAFWRRRQLLIVRG